MRASGAAPFLIVAALVAAAPLPARAAGQAPGGPNEPGRRTYLKWCAGCHGEQGKGDGPAAGHLLPKPRDFTRGVFKIRTTATGELPRDNDLRRIVDGGMPGSSMPAWKGTLSSGEREAVVRYIKSFSPAFAGKEPARLAFGGEPRGGRAAVEDGRQWYRRIQCFKCHGDAGRGDGPSAPTLKDDDGNPIRAADLAQNYLFRGGPTTEDIYRTLRTGLDGTPMPSFSDMLEGHQITAEQLWHVAQFVRSLSPDRPPVVRDVVRAGLVRGALPAGPDDSAWSRADGYYFPLVGQVGVRPRAFAPTVNGVWVKALHDGRALALRVAWHDPSRSPDSLWRVWRSRVARVMAADDSSGADTAAAFPDQLMVEFPAALTQGRERPHFLMGSTERPVYLWRWTSTPNTAAEGIARGMDQIEPLAPAGDSLSATATYDHGEWRVQFVRALSTADSADRPQFAPGRAIPMAFFAWDGSDGEAGTRGSVGSWVAIYLAEPPRAGTYAWPLLAMLSTGGLGLLVVSRAQRARHTASTPETGRIRPWQG